MGPLLKFNIQIKAHYSEPSGGKDLMFVRNDDAYTELVS